jgi:hypothetical protein
MTAEENIKRERDEFLEQRNRYAQLAYNLAEYIKAQQRTPLVRVTCPPHIMAQIAMARGEIKYEFPVR